MFFSIKINLCKKKQVIYGNWLIEGYPQVVLFDIKSAAYRLGQRKKELWESSHIGLLFKI